jgi:putative heme-binding domain-containing protein
VGGVLYAGRCADCHGPDAKGLRGPDLTQLWATGARDERVFASIRNGVVGSIMPPSVAPDNEIWAIVTYLRSISTVAPVEIPGADPEAGRALFSEHCSDCHQINGAGGSLGPELTRIALVRSVEALTQSVREPNATISKGYRTITLVTASGERIDGVEKSEDAYSIQIMDEDQRLLGFRKADLERVVRQGDSPMPQFRRGRISDDELQDILAFLGTLATADATAQARSTQ